MKRFVTFMMVVVFMTAAFAGGYKLAQDKQGKRFDSLFRDYQIYEKEIIDQKDQQISDLEDELRARTVLGNNTVDKAYKLVAQNGVLEYDLYVDGHLAVYVHAPVAEGIRTEWQVIRGIADDVEELRQHYDHYVEIEVKLNY